MKSVFYWQDKLPKSWTALPLKAIASYTVSNVDKHSHDGEIPVRLCNYTDVYKNDYITADMEFMNATATEEEIEKFVLEEGDILITKDSETWNDIGVPALVVSSDESLLCGYHLAMIEADNKKVLPRFLFQCIQSKDIRVQLELAASGVTRFGLSKYDIGRLVIPIPKAIKEQEKIVSYLEKATGQIDKLITEREAEIVLLAEKRQVLITQAVTKGLNRKAKMKDSGVDWLGEVPDSWEVYQLKHLSNEKLMYGANEAALEDNPDFPRFVRITDIDEEGNLRPETFKSLDPDLAQPFLLEDGDMLLARSGATVGKAFMYQTTWGIACFAGYLIRFRCNKEKLLPKFFNLIIQSDYYWAQVKSGLIQSTIPNFSADKYASMKILLPVLKEQSEIVKLLNNELGKIDNLVKFTKESIELLKERRAALITAAVTGQIEIN